MLLPAVKTATLIATKSILSLIYRMRCFDLLSHNLVLQLSNRLGQPKPNFVLMVENFSKSPLGDLGATRGLKST